ncbi:histidinol-phosphate aminotransferase 2 [bacterium BMS3Abin05]|nr:histidinol-phosphate aminotransferase 2 [bacterium BMS3Abin05]GBE26850.1 histidinol-phosphate aminotransferase 2 [bacterium BMS3Bbin03]
MIPFLKFSIQDLGSYSVPQEGFPVKLNQNESPFDIPSEIKQEIWHRFQKDEWSRYPTEGPEDLLDALSQYAGYPKEGILPGNGSNELIQTTMIGALNPGDGMLIIRPGFSVYPRLAKIFNVELFQIFLNQNLQFEEAEILNTLRDKSVQMILIDSPNNPTGALLKLSTIEKILTVFNGLFVLDEAYFEFSQTTAKKLIDTHQNLVILRTLSKGFSLAGLRLGYLLGRPKVVSELKKAKLPFSVNRFSQVAATVLFAHSKIILNNVAFIKKERERLFAEMAKISGIKPYPSEANFILFETTEKPVQHIFEQLKSQGILIRDVSYYPKLEKALRVTIGKPEENDRFLDALRKILQG